MGSRSTVLVSSLVVLAALTAAGCGGSSSPTEPIPSPSAGSLFAGSWSGTSAQGESLSFTVGGTSDALRLTRLALNVQLNQPIAGTGCLFVSGALGFEASPIQIPIVENRFTVRIPEDLPLIGLGGATMVFEGVLQAEQAAVGTLTAELLPTGPTQCGARGVTTWAARKG